MIEQVKQQIITAFSDLATPSPDTLLGPTTGDDKAEQRIQQELAGKAWQSLEADFLTKRWSAFCYLSAEGYRYYLPALMLRCLDDFSEANPLVHSTIYKLQPSSWSLYHKGTDEWFNRQTSLFSPPQYAAVCSFLELAFDRLPEMKFSAALALRWGWNRQENSATEKVRNFYNELHNYQWPVPDDPQEAALVEQIRAAFDATPYPGDDRLCSGLGDEAAEYALEFRGLDWRTIHPDLLAVHYASMCLFSDEAFRYFLPAYLLEDLQGNDSNTDPIFHLTHGLVRDKFDQMQTSMMESGVLPEDVVERMKESKKTDTFDWHQRAVDKFSLFSTEERKAIIAYLEHFADAKYRGEYARLALDRYWYQSLAQAEQH